MAKENQPEIEELSPKLSLEWLDGRKIVVFKFQDITLATMDAFFDRVEQVQGAWERDTPFLINYDMSQCKGVSVTPSGRVKTHEIAAANSDLFGRCIALLPTTSVVLNILKPALNMFIRRDINKYQPMLEFRIFTDNDKGMGWLREGLSMKRDNSK